MAEINVLIVEDDPLIAEDIRLYLTNVDYNARWVVHNKVDALEVLATEMPDIALLDINLGGNLDGITIAESINEQRRIPFLFLTSYSNKSIIEQAKYTHPMGYIIKPFDEADLYSSIEIALFNFAVLVRPAKLTRPTLNEILPEALTEKEFEVLEDIYQGMTNKQMSDKHFISINTVKSHLKNIYAKLNVHSRTEAMAYLRSLYV